MNLFEIYVIAIGLSMDVFAYALGKGALMSKISKKNLTTLCVIFTVSQTVNLLLGNLITYIPALAAYSERAAENANKISIMIFFGLGIYIIAKSANLKTIEEHKDDTLNIRQTLIMACVTSIDALLAGLGFGFLQTDFIAMVPAIAIVTCVCVICGVYVGYWMGCQFRRQMVTLGGSIILFGGAELIIRYIM